VRFGDPETQPIMLRLSSDLVDLVEAALDGDVTAVRVEWDARPALGVVLAAGGYPGKVRAGDVIDGAEQDFGRDVKVFHAGTATNAQGAAVSAGGRVLTVCALGTDLAQARAQAYAAIGRIGLTGSFYRNDIAYRALRRG